MIKWKNEGDLEWGLSKKTGTLIIKGKGPLEDYADGTKACQMKDYTSSGDGISPWRNKHRKLIETVVICYGVSSIGNFAFHSCVNLGSVVLPNSVISIGECAFDGCTGLTSVVIPDSVKNIGNAACGKCNFSSVKIPRSVSSFGGNPFSVREKLVTIVSLKIQTLFSSMEC